MRILAVAPGPSFSVLDLHVGYVEALRELGVHVIDFRLDERISFYEQAVLPAGTGVFRKALAGEQAIELAVNGLYAACYKTRPDVLLATSAFFLDPDLLDLVRHSGTRVVLVHTESPYEDDRQVKLAGHADLNLVNDPTNIDTFREQAPTFYLPHAYRPSLHHPGPPDPDLACDLAFVGTGYPSRVTFFEALAPRIPDLDVLLAGNWQALAEHSPIRGWVAHADGECLDNTQTVAVYRSARASINLYRREANRPQDAQGWAVGPREVELAATGCFFIREPRPEGDDLFPMLPIFHGPAGAAEALRWWTSHDEAREQAVAKAREAVAERTFTQNAKQLLRLLGA